MKTQSKTRIFESYGMHLLLEVPKAIHHSTIDLASSKSQLHGNESKKKATSRLSDSGSDTTLRFRMAPRSVITVIRFPAQEEVAGSKLLLWSSFGCNKGSPCFSCC
jgi:hypothetical protein